MNRFQTIISYGLVGLNVLLVFLLLFEEKLTVPLYLQPLGRMHPLLLHLPIGLFASLLLLMVFRKEFEAKTYSKIFILISGTTALLAVSTALFGLFLSNESGYSLDDLFWHKWTGVAFSIIAYLLYLFPNIANQNIQWGLVGGGFVAMFAAGHIGGEITHGEGFLFEAFEQEEQLVITDTSNIYFAKIYPILEDKCVQCHNDQKTKGELNMSSISKLMAGGKNGPIWEAGDGLNSHMIQRALLPIDDKKHMPPKSKPQLTEYEVQLLTQWINLGATTDKQIGDYKEDADFYTLAMAGEQVKVEKTYDFSAASESDIEAVNTPFCSVYPIAYNSPALEAKFFVRQRFDVKTLENLSKVKSQIVSLNLSKMPLTDDHIKLISQFENLEYLNLNATDITGATIDQLAGLKKLTSLALSNTNFEAENIDKLSQLTNLKELYAWETAITKKNLGTKNSQLTLFEGFDPSREAPLRLNPPQVVDAKTIFQDGETVKLKHVLPSVNIRYTLDGTTPDSVTGTVYSEPIEINKYTQLKAVAYKDGWYQSTVLENDFYKATFKATNAKLITEPNKQYTAEGSSSLIDGKKGSLDNFKDNNWLGYIGEPMVALFTFEEATPIKDNTLSYLAADDGYIMPPSQVEFWVGNSPEALKKLTTKRPPQPTQPQSRKSLGVNASVKDGKYKYVKIVAKPINPLPSWHPGRGGKGWVFIDEVFFN